MAKALLLLAALLVCGEAAQRGDDGNFLSFLRGGQTAKLKGAASKMDTQDLRTCGLADASVLAARIAARPLSLLRA